MQICVKCRREMRCTKTGATCRWNQGTHVYSGDEFECPECGAKIVHCNNNPWHQEYPVISKHDYIMDDWVPPEKFKHKKALNLRKNEDEIKNFTPPNRNQRASYRLPYVKVRGISYPVVE